MMRSERLVFVDPEDEEISYWWPAIIVPEDEYELFKETMDYDAVLDVSSNERLVCYFEDGSFSVVPKSSLIPFHPEREPYKSYSTRVKNFLTDAGIRRATAYHSKGTIPKLFKWLILSETGYLDPADLSDSDATKRKRVKVAAVVSSSSEPMIEVKRRGRKPKQKNITETGHINNSTNITKDNYQSPIKSPTPMNPSEMIKIEALLSQEIS